MSTMSEYAPAFPTSGYVAVPKNKRIEYEIFAVDVLYSDTLYTIVSLSSTILTKLQYYDDWIITEIDERLLPRPLSRDSIKVVGASILVVDDEPQICLGFKKTLESNGFRVDTFSDPRQALSNFKTGPPIVSYYG